MCLTHMQDSEDEDAWTEDEETLALLAEIEES